MQNIDVRNKFYICGRKIALILSLFIGTTLIAQTKTKINLVNYDKRKIHYGFQLGLNYSTFRIKQSEDFVTRDTFQTVRGVASTGFALGFLFNYRLGEFFDLRFTPHVGFYERTVRYVFNERPVPVDLIFQSSIIELPLVFKYKSDRRKNTRLYMVSGIKSSIEVGARRRQSQSGLFKTNNVDLSLEYGLGLDMYYPLFKFAPELRFSYGLSNLFLLDNSSSLFADPLQRISTYTVALFLYFE